jgi:hypothetical protein
MISLQVGDCWLWSLIIFMIQRFFLVVVGPHSLMGGGGGVGDFPPTNVVRGFQGGGDENFCSPLWRGIREQCPQRKILGKISL